MFLLLQSQQGYVEHMNKIAKRRKDAVEYQKQSAAIAKQEQQLRKFEQKQEAIQQKAMRDHEKAMQLNRKNYDTLVALGSKRALTATESAKLQTLSTLLAQQPFAGFAPPGAAGAAAAGVSPMGLG
jgi:hypothetical protein